LGEIAGEVGVSTTYLAQVFSEQEGIPLYRYHLQLRLARALDLLPKREDLTGLALDLGFSSHSHFTSAFRRHYGISPSEFRRMA
jgi:AraC-like DNA-binding protein